MKKLRRFKVGLMGVLLVSSLASCGEVASNPSDSLNPSVEPSASVAPTQTKAPEPTAEATKRKLEVSFDSNGGSMIDKLEVSEGDKVAKPFDPVKTGYTFKGWLLNDEAFDFSSSITKSITLRAKWEINKCKYSFYDLNGKPIKEETIDFGGKIIAPEMDNINVLDKYELIFKGWDKEIPNEISEDIKFTPVYEKIVNDYVYSVSFDNDKLVINGETAKKFIGSNIEISWEFPDSNKNPVKSTSISDDGLFKVEFLLNEFDLKHQGFAHVTITNNKNEVVLGGKTTNLAINKLENELSNAIIEGTAIEHQINYSKDGKTYFVGNAWDGLMLYISDNAKYYGNSSVALENENNKIYYVIKGTFLGYTEEELKLGYNMQHNDQIDHAGWGNEINDTEAAVKIDGNEFTVRIEASVLNDKFVASKKDKWAFTVHFGITGNLKDIKNVNVDNTPIALNGIEYSLQYDNQSFNTPALIIKDINSPVYNNATIENVDGKVIVTISGKCGYSKEFFKNLIAEENSMFNTNTWDGSWTKHNLDTIVEIKDGFLTLRINVTDLDSLGYKIQIHTTNDEAKDLAVSEPIDNNVILGNKKYRLFSKPGSGDPKEFWGNLAIIISNIEL